MGNIESDKRSYGRLLYCRKEALLNEAIKCAKSQKYRTAEKLCQRAQQILMDPECIYVKTKLVPIKEGHIGKLPIKGNDNTRDVEVAKLMLMRANLLFEEHKTSSDETCKAMSAKLYEEAIGKFLCSEDSIDTMKGAARASLRYTSMLYEKSNSEKAVGILEHITREMKNKGKNIKCSIKSLVARIEIFDAMGSET